MPQIFRHSANTLTKVSIVTALILANGAISLLITRLTIRGRSHTLPRHVASEAEHERVQAPCSRDFQLLAAKQV